MQTLNLIKDNIFYFFSIIICIYSINYNFGGPRHTCVWKKASGTNTKRNKRNISEIIFRGRVILLELLLVNINLTTYNLFPQLEYFVLLFHSFKYSVKIKVI